MLEIKRGHQQLYNAALEQRRAAWKRQRHSVTRTAQERDLTALRADDEAMHRLNAQASQLTLKRLDLAFQAFFRRVKAGETPGYPRFKSLKRFKGWGYKTHGDGWRLDAGEHMRHGHLRMRGVGKVRIRGGGRTPGEPKTCEITQRHGKWYASVTLACQPERRDGAAILAFDWGVETYATMARAGASRRNGSMSAGTPARVGSSAAAISMRRWCFYPGGWRIICPSFLPGCGVITPAVRN